MDDNLNVVSMVVEEEEEEVEGGGGGDEDGDAQVVFRSKKFMTRGQPAHDGHKSIIIIREVYESQNAPLTFEMQLENSLNTGYDIIVIEPAKLADETAQWIALGNFIHKSAVTAGLTSILTTYLFPDKPALSAAAVTFSCACTALYTLSWQKDKCSQYQVETDLSSLGIPLQALTSSSPVVIVKKNDRARRILHLVISSISGAYFGYRFFYTLPKI